LLQNLEIGKFKLKVGKKHKKTQLVIKWPATENPNIINLYDSNQSTIGVRPPSNIV